MWNLLRSFLGLSLSRWWGSGGVQCGAGMRGGDVKVEDGENTGCCAACCAPGGRVCRARFGAGFLSEEPGEHPGQGGNVL